MANENALAEMLCRLYPGVDKIADELGEEAVNDYIEYMKNAPNNRRNTAGFKNFNTIVNKARTKGLNSILYHSYVNGVKKSSVNEEGPHREFLVTPVIVVDTIYGSFGITNDNRIFKYWK